MLALTPNWQSNAAVSAASVEVFPGLGAVWDLDGETGAECGGEAEFCHQPDHQFDLLVGDGRPGRELDVSERPDGRAMSS